MNRYRVTWVIDIEADTPRDAAHAALAIQRNPNSTATVFDVSDDAGDDAERIDLLEEEIW